jgi:hypothetical protein
MSARLLNGMSMKNAVVNVPLVFADRPLQVHEIRRARWSELGGVSRNVSS